MKNKLHLYRCIVDLLHSLQDELYKAQIDAEKNHIDCPIAYVMDLIKDKWGIYVYKKDEWILLDQGELNNEEEV